MGAAEIMIALGARVEGCLLSSWGMFLGFSVRSSRAGSRLRSPDIVRHYYFASNMYRHQQHADGNHKFGKRSVFYTSGSTSTFCSDFTKRFNRYLLFGAP